MKRIVLFILFCPLLSMTQEYVDLINIGYANTFNASFKGTDEHTDVRSFFTNLTFPVVLNEKHTLITGGDFSNHQLQLFPNAETTHLYSLLFKIGVASTFSENWSGTFVFLPKLASDYQNLSAEDLYYGGFALLKYQKTDRLTYRFGFYASTEAYGVFATPIVGAYYVSKDRRFELDVSMPVSADINYTFGKTTLGFDYYGFGRSYRLDVQPQMYLEQSPLEFSSYLQFNILQNSILLRTKIGYTSNENEVYAKGDQLGLRVSAFDFGDDRNRLNPEISGGIFVKIETIYRFHIRTDKHEPEN